MHVVCICVSCRDEDMDSAMTELQVTEMGKPPIRSEGVVGCHAHLFGVLLYWTVL